jgi:hypothetical protein
MWQLTKQEQMVLLSVLTLLLVGAGVKAYRLSHPPMALPGSSR